MWDPQGQETSSSRNMLKIKEKESTCAQLLGKKDKKGPVQDAAASQDLFSTLLLEVNTLTLIVSVLLCVI